MSEIVHEFEASDRVAMEAMRVMLAINRRETTRASFDEATEQVPDVPGVSYVPGEVGGVSGVWCRPARVRPSAALLYLHGGAFIFGSAHAFRHFAGHLASSAGLATFVADYRLAPEHPFPAALDDARAAYRGLADTNDRVAIAGDSAGGGIALTVLAEGSGSRGNQPCAGVLLSPWTDLLLTGESIEARAHEDPLLTRSALEAGARLYLKGHDARDPRASPLFRGDHADLPPIEVHVGTAEILLDDARRLAAHAPVDVHVWEGMPHVFQRNVGTLAAARKSLAQMGTFLDQECARAHR